MGALVLHVGVRISPGSFYLYMYLKSSFPVHDTTYMYMFMCNNVYCSNCFNY